jgi:hypothetical protein
MHDEDVTTDISTDVLKLRLGRRRLLAAVRTLCVIAVGVAAGWFFLDHLKDTGWNRLTRSGGAPPEATAHWTLDEAAAPQDGTAAVEVHLLSTGQLWLDTALVPADTRVLRLAPGMHRLTAHFKDRMVTQQLRTLEGEVYHVELGDVATAQRIAPK